MDKRPLKVAISIPTEGVTTPEAYDNRLMMAFHLGKYQAENPDRFEFYWFTAGSMFVPMAREQLAKHAMAGDMDLMMMIDDDMLTPLDLFEALYLRMEENFHVDIIAPLAFTRNPPHLPVLYKCTDGFDVVSRQKYFKNEYVRNYPKDALVECDAVGFGAVLIKCNVLELMKPPWFMSTSPTGEDVLFCYNAKKVGARVFMDTSVKLTHLGNPVHVDEEYAGKHWKQNGTDVERQYGKYEKVG